MELDATAGSCPVSTGSALKRAGRSMVSIAVPVASISLLLLAWVVWREGIYTSASDLGYWLGVAGGSLMLVLLIYPLRKRYRALAVLGPLKHWFRFHLVAGIAGPVIVLFHSTFRIGSFNAAIALASMLLVVASGLVGRFVYRKIHHGLFGSRATATELQRALEQQMDAMRELLLRLPLVEHEIRQFSALVARQPEGRWQRALHFASLGLQRLLAGRRVHRAITACGSRAGDNNGAQDARLQALARSIDDTLKAMQRTAQFSTYEKLFSLWHVVHIPFLCMLVVTAIVHVVAVHAY
jgi:hypothetical protein